VAEIDLRNDEGILVAQNEIERQWGSDRYIKDESMLYLNNMIAFLNDGKH
jgi:hypothetical protein